MKINTNVGSINALRMHSINNGKLSSGMRINRAADDAAGLSISEKMRGQIRGLNQAVLNSKECNSLLNTADGVMNEVSSMIHKCKNIQ